MKRKLEIVDKIIYCKKHIKNLHFSKLLEIENITIKYPNWGLFKTKQIFTNGWKPINRNGIEYWLIRGWPEHQAYFKAKENSKKLKGKLSPFSYKFWLKKTNEDTNKLYTEKEAKFKAKSIVPIHKEYYLNKGYDEKSAINLAKQQKEKNNNNGVKIDSNIRKIYSSTSLEYYLIRGYSEKEAKELQRKRQQTFSLKICVEKYGEEVGYKKWKDRQDKWQNTLKSKPQEEINEINRRKNLWCNESYIGSGILYLIELTHPNGNKYIKIGITKRNINKRFSTHIQLGFKINILKEYALDSFYDCFIIEQEVLEKYKKWLQYDDVFFDGYTECFYDTIDVDKLIEEIECRI